MKGAQAVKKIELSYWRPADEYVWLRRIPIKGGLRWKCGKCGWEEIGPIYDLPMFCPGCDHYMLNPIIVK